MKHTIIVIAVAIIAVLGIILYRNTRPLPYLGERDTILVDGKEMVIYPTVPAFSFISQDSTIISNQTLLGKVYVAEFMFLSCGTICPKMNREMKRVYDAYKTEPDLLLLSHTIDPERDSIPRLKAFTNAMGADSKKWICVTGDEDKIYEIAEKGYYSIAYRDSVSEDGFAHSGGLLLIDRQQHVRGIYDGTLPHETERLIKDIKKLL